jgi:hypothetical protein
MNPPAWLGATLWLQRLGAALGIPADEWPVLERLGSVQCQNREIARETVAELDVHLVQSASGFYGDALRATIRFGRDDELVLSSSLDRSAVDRFLAATPDNPTYILNLTLNKGELVTAWWGQKAGCHPYLFLFEPFLESLLDQDLGQIEATFFPEGQDGKAIFVVPEREILLDGPHLALIGGTALTGWGSILPTSAGDSARAQRVYDDCRERLTWQREWVQRLTPFHLALLPPAPSDAPAAEGRIVDLLHIHFANLALLFTAQRSEVAVTGIVSVYASASRAIRVPHRPTSASVTSEERNGVQGILDILAWTYDAFGQESRIALVQDILVRELIAVDESDRCGAFVRRSSTSFAQLSWSWQSFVGDRVDAYLAQVRELEGAVDRTIQGFADQLASLIKSLTDTMLGAVAAVLAALVAAAVKDDFQLWIFLVGVVAYGLYVLLFHVLYGLPFQSERFQALKDDFETRRRWFEERVPPEQVAKIVGDRIEESETRWNRWYDRTKHAYWGLLIVLLLGAVAAGVVDGAGVGRSGVAGTPTTVGNRTRAPETVAILGGAGTPSSSSSAAVGVQLGAGTPGP